jgi:hypothetical protein
VCIRRTIPSLSLPSTALEDAKGGETNMKKITVRKTGTVRLT